MKAKAATSSFHVLASTLLLQCLSATSTQDMLTYASDLLSSSSPCSPPLRGDRDDPRQTKRRTRKKTTLANGIVRILRPYRPTGTFNTSSSSSSLSSHQSWSRTRCGNPSGNSDIPTKWTDSVDPEKPLPMYPRPQMVRCGRGRGQRRRRRRNIRARGDIGDSVLRDRIGCGCLSSEEKGDDHDDNDGHHEAIQRLGMKRLRDEGDGTTWQNLNGLWEWEEAEDRDRDSVFGSDNKRDAGPDGGDGDGRYFFPHTPPQDPPFGRTLRKTILVPYPVESCLSGVAPLRSSDVVRSMWYRLEFEEASESASASESESESESVTSSSNDHDVNGDNDDDDDGERILMHFGAVDWSTHVYLDGKLLGNHTGGYDGFHFDVTRFFLLGGRPMEEEAEEGGEGGEATGRGGGRKGYKDGRATESGGAGHRPIPPRRRQQRRHELLVHVYDPSDAGPQPNGKQRISAIDACGGDTYTPSSGIWQTVWLERVPPAYISDVSIDQASVTKVAVRVRLGGGDETALAGGGGLGGGVLVTADVFDGSAVVASTIGPPGEALHIAIPNAKLWSPSRPFLYDLRIALHVAVGCGGGKGDVADEKDGVQKGKGETNEARKTGKRRLRKTDSSDPATPYPHSPPPPTTTTTMDVVVSYFGLRTYAAASFVARSDERSGSNEGKTASLSPLRPALNGHPIFLAGVLDQSYWPDGLYAAPTDEALAYDVRLVRDMNMNLIRLHQKVNPERWYYHADREGVVVFQDMVQKYKNATSETVPLFVHDVEATILGRGNHPSVVQWTVFNEGDCWDVFKEEPYDVPGLIGLVRSLDPTRPIDTDSGGKADGMKLGDVHDVHTYPYPGNPIPSESQYAMIGEYGGLGLFVDGKEWKPGGCFAYKTCGTSTEYAILYSGMAALLERRMDHIGAAVYTQTTDLECECDGLVNYDRTAKFSEEELDLIRKANERLTRSHDRWERLDVRAERLALSAS